MRTLHPSVVGEIWNTYKKNGINQTVHPDDTMYLTGKDWYWSVGESAMLAVCAALIAAPIKKINKLLDFGCGYGRCARHLRALFPDAELFFCDLNKPAADFCAGTLNGKVLSFSDIPLEIDLIWLGSVFTHLSLPNSKILFDSLTSKLTRGGVLICTSHGRRAIEIHKRNPYISKDKWLNIYDEYQSVGYGYSSYGREDLGDYGVSLANAAKIIALGENRPDLRLITYQEGGWANHQDVAAWAHWPLHDS